MQVDLFLFAPRIEDIRDRARQAEDGGFDGLFVAETFGDPFQCLAVASQHTARTTLGTSIALAFTRSPMTTALAAWDLQRATRGRFVLGLGSQVRRHVERRFSMPFDPPVTRMREYAQAVRHIWGAFQEEHPLAFHGDYYSHDYLPPGFMPGSLDWGPPPLYIAAVGPRMFEAAGAVADGALIHPIHTVEYLRQVAEPALTRGLEQSNRDRRTFGLSVTVLCIVGTGEGEGHREAVRRQFAMYASTPAYRPVLELHGWGEISDRLRNAVRSGAQDTMAALVPDELLEQFSVVAQSWPAAIEVARARYEGVADRLMFQNAPPLHVVAGGMTATDSAHSARPAATP